MDEKNMLKNDNQVRDDENIAIQISGVKKRYRLGLITAGTLKGDIQSWWARKRGKEDPTLKIGAKVHGKNEVFWALSGIDLTIYKGERIGIIGHNGAGKSTLLKLLARVTGPTEGEIKIDGRITSMLEVGTGFNGELTGRENVYLNGAILGMTKKEVDKKMEQIIDFSECRQFIDTPVKRYSSGMFVKLAFSVAAHLDSEIMIMDEVLAVGDMAFQKKCLEKMSEVSKDEGRTILYVSHNMNTIRQLCSRCIVLNHGKIIFNGDVEDAIGIYLGKNNSDYPVFYDMDKMDRPYKQHGVKVRITEFEILSKAFAIFSKDELVKFRLKFKANENIKNLKISLSLRSVSGIPVGLSQTYDSILNSEKGKEYEYTFNWSLSNIVDGEYYLELDMFSDDGNGHHLSYDHPICNIIIKKINSNPLGVNWQSKYYGFVALEPITKVKNEEKN